MSERPLITGLRVGDILLRSPCGARWTVTALRPSRFKGVEAYVLINPEADPLGPSSVLTQGVANQIWTLPTED